LNTQNLDGIPLNRKTLKAIFLPLNMNTRELIHEIKHHIPFTTAATIIAIAAVYIVNYYFKFNISSNAFEILHPLHIIVSAIVTGGIFYRYKPKIIPALLVALSGSIIVGSLSDIFLPWLGGNIFGLSTSFHLPLLETPLLIISAALLGGIVGISTKITKTPHFLHVGLSVFASLFYLLAFSQGFSASYFILALVIVLVAVVIPCCISDILYPFFFLNEKIKHCDC